MTSQGRVKIWVTDSTGGRRSKAKVIEFSAYGEYLKDKGDRLIDFNEQAISIVSPEGTLPWHNMLEMLQSQ
jgi:uncharacterized beta-barrel protein YwiB (DUF1934 family)